jgi:predicted CXXCH cytochrome family protein
MCYTCHDNDGPASTDMQTAFASASHHNVSSVDQVDGSRVECTNCHNPHTASAALPLGDPDTGGAQPWSGTRADFCLTCHDGNAPANVAFPGSAPGTGYDKSRYLGTTHAIELGSQGCLHCHDAHGSAFAAMLMDEYRTADDNASYQASQYNMCWVCHDENSTVWVNNAFKDRHKRHVNGVKAPCIICHDVHGGFEVGEPGLIDLDYSVTHGYDIHFNGGSDGNSAFWIDTGQNRGYCNLTCHNKNHNPKNYDRNPSPAVDCSACHASPPVVGAAHGWVANLRPRSGTPGWTMEKAWPKGRGPVWGAGG